MATIPTTDCSFGDIVIAHNTTFPSTPVSTNNINLKTYFSGKTVYSPGGTGTLIPASNISTSLFYGKTFQEPISPPTLLSGSPRNGFPEQSTLSWVEPASLPTLGSGENITYEIFVLNQDPGNPPNSFYALKADQVGSSGLPSQSRSYNTGNGFSAFRNPTSGSSPTGKYYFMIRTRKNNSLTGALIIASDWVSSGAIDPEPYTDADLNIYSGNSGNIYYMGASTPGSDYADNVDWDTAKSWVKNQSSGGNAPTFDNFFKLSGSETNPMLTWTWQGSSLGTGGGDRMYWKTVKLYNNPAGGPGQPNPPGTGGLYTGGSGGWNLGTNGYGFTRAGENPAPRTTS